MPKKNTATPPPAPAINPDCGCPATETTAPATMPIGAERLRWRYVGPYYNLGFQLTDGSFLRPNDWTDDEVDARLEDGSCDAAWFEPMTE